MCVEAENWNVRTRTKWNEKYFYINWLWRRRQGHFKRTVFSLPSSTSSLLVFNKRRKGHERECQSKGYTRWWQPLNQLMNCFCKRSSNARKNSTKLMKTLNRVSNFYSFFLVEIDSLLYILFTFYKITHTKNKQLYVLNLILNKNTTFGVWYRFVG